jgi:hypothetical protein
MRIGVRVIGIAMAAAVAGMLSASEPAQAQQWPWCADMYEGRGGGTATNCGFASFQQCQAYISGMSGRCYPNPWYTAQERPRRQPERYR